MSMRKSSLINFKKFEISKSETVNTKGGIFCEIYVGYVEANGESINSGQMQKGMLLDTILATDGMDAALQQGGSTYLAKYS